MEMRLRFPELFAEHETTPWRVAQASNGRISPNVLYRLRAKRGVVKLLSADLLEALCDVLDVDPGELLEHEERAKRKKKR